MSSDYNWKLCFDAFDNQMLSFHFFLIELKVMIRCGIAAVKG